MQSYRLQPFSFSLWEGEAPAEPYMFHPTNGFTRTLTLPEKRPQMPWTSRAQRCSLPNAARFSMVTNYFLVALGGALGSVSRFWLSGVTARHFGETFPWGTLIVNVTGSFAIGFFAALTAPDGRWFVSPGLRNFFMAGLLGGYTTFSSFSLQTLSLAENGEYGRAAGNAFGSMAGCLVAVWLGHVLAQTLNTLKGD